MFGIRTKGRGTRRVAGTTGCLRNLSLSQRAFVEAAFRNEILRPLSWILMFCSKTRRFLFWKLSLGVKPNLKPFWVIWKLSHRCDGNVFSVLKMFSLEEQAATPASTTLLSLSGWNCAFGGRSCVLLSLADSDSEVLVKVPFYCFDSCSVWDIFSLVSGDSGSTDRCLVGFLLFSCAVFYENVGGEW